MAKLKIESINGQGRKPQMNQISHELAEHDKVAGSKNLSYFNMNKNPKKFAVSVNHSKFYWQQKMRPTMTVKDKLN